MDAFNSSTSMNFSNQTDPFSCSSPSVLGYRYFAVVWGCAVTITGTLGNLLTVFAFSLDPRLRTRFNVLIVNLAMADLLYCTILQPISVDSYLHLHWRTGATWCRAFGFLLFVSNSVSIITLCLLAIGRYLLVAKRQLFDKVFSKHGVVLLVIFAWGLGIASFAPLWTVYVFVPNVCTCSFHRTEGRPYTTILLFFYFFVGLGCVGIFYLLIYKRVKIASQALLKYRLSRRSSKKKPVSSSSGTDSGVESGVANTSTSEVAHYENITQSERPGEKSTKNLAVPNQVCPKPNQDAQPQPKPTSTTAADDGGEFKRVTRMCFTVFICFVLCFFPFIILNIVDKNNRAPQVLHMFSANLTWLNSCINPVLYAIMNRQFRQAYHVLLTKITVPFRCLCN
ncbi:G-protein coupled receptor 84 [Periophthalmus magnuspinnatus]|uniref:G-protein coupled receptor 84 n=1 Tax=Periophthalmus magnuspinnatus TaxID=409849 RepID=UPI00145A6407|nr:G-protein coupled receptor 84 [Periophthalmus magnuspinnatus]